MTNEATKICSKCGQEKPHSAYWMRTVGGRPYPASACISCANQHRNTKRKEGTWARSQSSYEDRKRWADTAKYERLSGRKRGRFVLEDCRKSDRKKGFENDLTREFVDDALAKPCTYCEDTEAWMTLDRIDNSLGHTQANVVPSCYRCNMIRRDMPYEAWIMFKDTLKQVREAGLFASWQSRSPLVRS